MADLTTAAALLLVLVVILCASFWHWDGNWEGESFGRFSHRSKTNNRFGRKRRCVSESTIRASVEQGEKGLDGKRGRDGKNGDGFLQFPVVLNNPTSATATKSNQQYFVNNQTGFLPTVLFLPSSAEVGQQLRVVGVQANRAGMQIVPASSSSQIIEGTVSSNGATSTAVNVHNTTDPFGAILLECTVAGGANAVWSIIAQTGVWTFS